MCPSGARTLVGTSLSGSNIFFFLSKVFKKMCAIVESSLRFLRATNLSSRVTSVYLSAVADIMHAFPCFYFIFFTLYDQKCCVLLLSSSMVKYWAIFGEEGFHGNGSPACGGGLLQDRW